MSELQDILDAIRGLGANFNPAVQAATKEIYRRNIDLTPADEKLDINYGPDDRQVLDVYLPKTTATGVVLFIHGGGFVGGDKNEDGTFYGNLGRFLARNGLIGVLPSYRRAPDHGWPAAAHDVRDAVAWWHTNASNFSAASLPVYVIGQSAGACHVATWLFDDQARGVPLQPISKVMLMSGYYNAVEPMADNIRAYFGSDPSVFGRRSPLTHVKKIEIPVTLSVAEFDPGIISARTYELAAKLSLAFGSGPEVVFLKGHNHVSTVMSIGSPHESAALEMLKFAGVSM